MTPNQESVIEELYRRNMSFLAAATKHHWEHGEEYYIDSRVPVSKGLRKRFAQGNAEAMSLTTIKE